MPSKTIHIAENDKILFLFFGWVVLHWLYIYIPCHLYPFISWWTLKVSISWLLEVMLPWTLRCMYCFKLVFSLTSHIYSGVELLNYIIVLFLLPWTFIFFSIVNVSIYIPTNNLPLALFMYLFCHKIVLAIWDHIGPHIGQILGPHI